jgi:hypothetical protein
MNGTKVPESNLETVFLNNEDYCFRFDIKRKHMQGLSTKQPILWTDIFKEVFFAQKGEPG